LNPKKRPTALPKTRTFWLKGRSFNLSTKGLSLEGSVVDT
jgi:hypothetical protein